MSGLLESLLRPEFLGAAAVIVGGTVAVLYVTRARRRAERVEARPAPAAGTGTDPPHAPAPTEHETGDDETLPAPPSVTFDDVAGLEDALDELREVREYLTDPARFRALGADMPRGILLYGLPGCGKTLLARALAGEAGVPFYSVSAASFVERFVGTGAARVRELFEKAKKTAPCIVFIDELDAIGRKRSSDSGGEREYDHTLNQLLVELDGFSGATGVLILGATNRPELIDDALMRPGRFDRRIRIERPDRQGREQILRLHAAKRPFSRRIDWEEIAGQTAGLSAAELANICNEASLLAARRHRERIPPEDVEEACTRVVAGTPSSRLISDEDKRLLAVHEAGHAVLSTLVKDMQPPSRISILARSGGFDRSVWTSGSDREFLTRHDLTAQLIVLLGGRGAELNTFGEPSTKAEDDLSHAAELARQMVERWAMTGRFELAGAGDDRRLPYTEGTAGAQEVRRLVSKAERAARTILSQHTRQLRSVAEVLVERETITSSELSTLMQGGVVDAAPRRRQVGP